MLKKILETDDNYALLPARLVLAAIFFAHGGQKLFGWFGGPGLENTITVFQNWLGIPAPLTILAATTEFFGALAVLIGLLTRVAALGLAITMLLAIFLVHLEHGFFLNWTMAPNVGHGIEMNLALLGLCVPLLVAGAGALSLDRKLTKR